MEVNWWGVVAALWLSLGYVKYRIYFRAMMQFMYILNEINPGAYMKRFNIRPENDTFDDARFYRPVVFMMVLIGLPVILVKDRTAFFKDVEFEKLFHFIKRRYGGAERAGDGR